MKTNLAIENILLLDTELAINWNDKKESIFKELDLQKHLEDDTTLFKYMSENPKLIERPIIVRGDKAILGRPPEKITDFLKD